MGGVKSERPKRVYRFLIFLVFTGLGALAAWLLFNFKAPGGIIVMMGSILGYFVSLSVGKDEEIKAPSILELREQGPWPAARKVSAVAFLLFFLLAGLFSSPRILEDEDCRRAVFLLFSGLALLGGTPLMFALKSNLRLLGFCTLFISLMLIAVGLLGVFEIGTPPFLKMLILLLGMVAPLVIILIMLGRSRK